jgi:hypothetical protein
MSLLFIGKTCANELETRANGLKFSNGDQPVCMKVPLATPITGKCPVANTQIIHPIEGFGSFECIDLSNDRDRCKRYIDITCVGIKTSETGKCYAWHCDNLPKNGDHVLEIDGPEYNKIVIRINPPPPVWVVLSCFGIIVFGFVMVPELMFGICLGSLRGKDTNNDFSS